MPLIVHELLTRVNKETRDTYVIYHYKTKNIIITKEGLNEEIISILKDKRHIRIEKYDYKINSWLRTNLNSTSKKNKITYLI